MGNTAEQSSLVVPDELTGPTPRRASLSDSARRGAVALAFGSVLVLIFTILTARIEIPQIRTRIALRSNTRLAIAQITSLHSGGRGIEIVEYTFNGAAGQATSGSATVPYNLIQLMRESRQIIVRYRPSDPAINHPDAWEWSLDAEHLFGGFAFVCFWFGGVAAIVYPIYLLRLRKLILYGRPAIATIDTSARNGRVFSCKYTFRSDEGFEWTGKSSTTRELAVGAATWVLYLPQSPRRNCLYPSTQFEIYS
ncbi:MAG TPA: hypothetical protein VGF82_11550 [Terracidiphilus sp.]